MIRIGLQERGINQSINLLSFKCRCHTDKLWHGLRYYLTITRWCQVIIRLRLHLSIILLLDNTRWCQVIIWILSTISVNNTENYVCWMDFICLVLSLWIAKHSALQQDSTGWRAGCAELIRISAGKFSEVGSSINCVRWVWFGCSRRPLLGACRDRVFSRSGIILARVSAVTLHRVSTCTMSSVCAGFPGNANRQSWHEGSCWGSLQMYLLQG